MDETLWDLVKAMKVAIASGRPPMDAAIAAWEIKEGSRVGLSNALLQLADQGVIQGDVIQGGRGGRRVLRIVAVSTEVQPKEQIDKNRRVFVVYGRDEATRQSMFNFLRAINLHPMEWRELLLMSGAGTPYIGEVLDRAFDLAQAIVVLFTPDEEVCLSKHLGGGDKGLQARPNALFEAGLALGRNPTRTVIVEVGELRAFSDIAGRHVVRLDDLAPDRVARRQDLAQRLEQAGCNVSLRGTDWHSAGTFTLSGSK